MKDRVKEYHDILVRDLSKLIKEKVSGATLFGLPVDADNPDEVLCVVYLMAQLEELGAIHEH